jgi:hypothetical protein
MRLHSQLDHQVEWDDIGLDDVNHSGLVEGNITVSRRFDMLTVDPNHRSEDS